MKKFIIWLTFIIVGTVIGAFAAHYLGQIPFLSWLTYGTNVGLSTANPMVLDLFIMKLAFGIEFNVNIAQGIFVLFGSIGFYFLAKRL